MEIDSAEKFSKWFTLSQNSSGLLVLIVSCSPFISWFGTLFPIGTAMDYSLRAVYAHLTIKISQTQFQKSS